MKTTLNILFYENSFKSNLKYRKKIIFVDMHNISLGKD